LARAKLHVVFLSVTIGIAFPAIVVMTVYRRLRIHRLALHRNLLVAIVLRSVFVLVTKSVVGVVKSA
jgi:hypothetical protein